MGERHEQHTDHRDETPQETIGRLSDDAIDEVMSFVDMVAGTRTTRDGDTRL